MMKKNIAKLLVFAMLLTMLPLSAMAATTPVTTIANNSVTVSSVKVNGGSALTATGTNSPYTFASDVTATAGEKVTVSFTITKGAGEYTLTRDSEDITIPSSGSVSDEITATGTSTQTVTYTISQASNTVLSFKVTFKVTAATVAVTSVTVDPDTLTLEKDKKQTLTAKVLPAEAPQTVKWTSSDAEVATVNETTGEVTAIKAGEATITATSTADQTKSGTCTVTVPAVVEVEVDIGDVTPTTEKVDGKDISTAPIASDSVNAALAEAKAGADAVSEEPVLAIVSIDVSDKTVDGVKLENSVFQKANDYNVGWDTAPNNNKELVVSVALPEGTVRLDKNAIAKIAAAGAAKDVIVSVKAATNDIPADKKPSGTVKLSFDVNITVDGEKPSWGNTADQITLTVPNTINVTDTTKLDVYLDKDLASNANVAKNGDNLDIKVPHLTYVTLVEKSTPSGGGGGGGGGSSKPSVKPGDKPTTPGTTAPGGGVAGFNDVSPSAWYADSVKFVVDRGLFGGVGNGNFAPNANMTRAMMWTVLARYMGVNTDTGANWYEAARAWAIEKGISDGTMADGNVTREQFVTMLWRLSGEPTVDNAASFTDSGSVSGYAKTAVDWAVAQGIVNGYNDGSFKPQGSATRAEVAKMLTVFVQNQDSAADAG